MDAMLNLGTAAAAPTDCRLERNPPDEPNQPEKPDHQNKLNSMRGGSRGSGSRRAGAPVALTLRQPGGNNQGEGPVGSAPESRCHWFLRRESSPVSPHA